MFQVYLVLEVFEIILVWRWSGFILIFYNLYDILYIIYISYVIIYVFLYNIYIILGSIVG